MKMIEIKFFRKQKCLRKYSNIGRVGGHKLKTLHYPLNLTLFELSSKVSYRALNETMPMREKGKIKKNLTASHTPHKALTILTLISTIWKEWGHEIKNVPTSEVKNKKKLERFKKS